MAIFAPTQFLIALSPFAWPGAAVPVVRVSERVPTARVVVADIVSSPGFVDVVSMVQVPAPLAIVHWFPATKEPTCAPTYANVTTVPFGASVYVPEPVFTNTCAVYVCVVLIGLTADSGLIVMYASTNVLTTSLPFSPCPSVWTVTGAAVPRSDSVLEA